MKDQVPPTQAESVESLRAKAVSRANAGDESGPLKIIEPKRKRAYHRALKRGEFWAVYRKSIIDILNLTNKVLYEVKNESMETMGLSRILDYTNLKRNE